MNTEHIKLQILLLESQKMGIEAQLQALEGIRCSYCKDGLTDITEDRGCGVLNYRENCIHCDGSGYASGRHPNEYPTYAKRSY